MKRIFLIGYMGAGKTTVGQDLAKRLGLSFIDLDHYLEARYHKTVSQIFSEKGEEEFRKLECKMLREVAMFEDVLISTGGGLPCFYDNISFMNKNGTTIYLKVSAGELAKRVALTKHTRPVLKGRSGKELENFISKNLQERDPYYKQASIIFDAEVMLTDNDVQEISKALGNILKV